MPIIVLSARSDERDKIEALDAGADDYLAKPFGIGELLARVRVALRRHGANAMESPRVTFGSVTVDLSQRLVSRDGETLHLTPTEFKLLALLLANAGKVMTQRQLLVHVWGTQRGGKQPLSAHLYGAPATKTGKRPHTTSSLYH